MRTRNAWLILTAALFSACGSGQDFTASGYSPSASNSSQQQQQQNKASEGLITITSPKGVGGHTSSSDKLSLSGLSQKIVGAIVWQTDAGLSGEVAAGKQFKIESIPLRPGDNQITLVGRDASGAEFRLLKTVTYNPTQNFISPFNSNPRGIFVNEATSVRFSVGLEPNPGLNRPSVQLVQVDESGQSMRVLGTLVDQNNNFQFSGTFSITPSQEEYLRYRVVGDAGGQTFASEIREILVTTHVSDSEIQLVQDTSKQAMDVYLASSNQETQREAGIAAALSFLNQAPGVLAAGRASDNAGGIWIVFENRLLSSLFLNPPGTNGGGGGSVPFKLSDAQDRPDRSFGQQQHSNNGLLGGVTAKALDDDKIIPDISKALVMVPFGDHFPVVEPSYKIEELLGNAKPTAYPPTELTITAVDVDACRRFDQYGVVTVNSHGLAVFNFNGVVSTQDFPLPTETDQINRQRRLQSLRDQYFRWSTPGEQSSFLTREPVNSVSVFQHELELRSGALAFGQILETDPRNPNAKVTGTYFSIMPSFIEQEYATHPLKDSLVSVSACQSLSSESLSSAFLASGGATFIGYSGPSVSSPFVFLSLPDFFDRLINQTNADGSAYTTGQAYQRVQDPNGPPGTFIELRGSEELVLEDHSNLLKNADFSQNMSFWSNAGRYVATGFTEGVNGIPNLGQGISLILDAPFVPATTSQVVTLPTDGNYEVTYIGIGQYDPVEATISVTDVETQTSLATDVWQPPPTLSDVSVRPFLTTGASWRERKFTFSGRADQVIRFTVHVRHTTPYTGNGDIGIFDNFVLRRRR